MGAAYLGQEDFDVFLEMARNRLKYVPHLYRGGYVIVGFGYSVERIGEFVSAEDAGRPDYVE